MNQLIAYIPFLLFMLFQVEAQFSPPSQQNMFSYETNFQPSLRVVISALTIMFTVSSIILIYAKYCHRGNQPVNNDYQRSIDGLIRSGSGIDRKVIESLPVFRFSLLKGSREGLECAVCLSRFEDVEILRLLPKCKHAFHIDCVDQWLEKHSSCPLCRQKVRIDDLSALTYSDSLRFLWNLPELREDSNIEVFIQREKSHKGSSKLSIGNSFRKFEKGKKEENHENSDEENGKMLHKFNHEIIVSDFVSRNRWSNVSSSDLMLLNSEMINSISSDRFSSLDFSEEKPTKNIEEVQIVNIKGEKESQIDFESTVSKKKYFASKTNHKHGSRISNPREKRSMSDITVLQRSSNFVVNNSIGESHHPEHVTKEEKVKRLWYTIVQRTAQWFANRETRSQASTSQSLNV